MADLPFVEYHAERRREGKLVGSLKRDLGAVEDHVTRRGAGAVGGVVGIGVFGDFLPDGIDVGFRGDRHRLAGLLIDARAVADLPRLESRTLGRDEGAIQQRQLFAIEGVIDLIRSAHPLACNDVNDRIGRDLLPDGVDIGFRGDLHRLAGLLVDARAVADLPRLESRTLGRDERARAEHQLVTRIGIIDLARSAHTLSGGSVDDHVFVFFQMKILVACDRVGIIFDG